MKRSYQLMQIFDIEKNYSRHKQNLRSIQHKDPKRQASKSTIQNQQSTSAFKKSHSIATSFISKEQTKKLDRQNAYLYKNLINHSSRQMNMTMRKNSDSSKSLMRNTSLTIRTSRIKEENQKIQKKISGTKSSYEKLRKSSHGALSGKKNQNSQDELRRLLQNQFRIKPQVLFPQIRKNSTQTGQKAKQKNKQYLKKIIDKSLINHKKK